MEYKIWKMFISLGVPGLALGIFYMLYNTFDWQLERLPITWVVTIIVLFMILTFTITYRVLTLWSPESKVEKESQRSGYNVTLGNQTKVTGMIAGRDIIMQSESLKDRLDELIGILNQRANKIANDLSKKYKYVKVEKYLTDFMDLHEKHVEALNNGQIILAHEILINIHELSRKLERDEFWTKHEKETPDLLYRLDFTAFSDGPMIIMYAGKETRNTLRFDTMKSEETEKKSNKAHTAVNLYKKILGEM